MTSQAEIHDLVYSEDINQRRKAATLIKEKFGREENREAAWKELIKLSQDGYSLVRLKATDAIISVFNQAPDKFQSQKDLHKLAQDENSDVRLSTVGMLESVFGHVLNKSQAQEDLHRFTQDEYSLVRLRAADALASVFDQVPNKSQAQKDLHKLAQDRDKLVRWRAADALVSIFGQVPNKSQAWVDLIRLAKDEDFIVRSRPANALGKVFDQVPDKSQAQEDLHRLAQDDDDNIRSGAAYALGSAFSEIPEKDQAEEDLHRLAQDEDGYVRSRAAGALGLAFSLVPDKSQAWMDLHRLAQDEGGYVRSRAAGALGLAFSLVPDKDQAWMDLHRLAQDEDSEVRCASYHSLGRISILRATESDGDFRTHLEEAIKFFRRSSEDAEYFNPASFCLPFYQSLHSLLFTEMQREDEVQRYLAEAKEAIASSESREVLLEAVNNLSKALHEVRSYSIDDITLRKRDLRSYTRYCLKTAECLREARDKTPMASKIIDYTLVEKSIPIIDQKIKAAFKDVEAAAGRLCKSTKGTDLEAFGKDAYESTRGLNKVDSWIAADQYLERIVPLLKRHCNRLPTEAQEHLKTLVDSQDIASLEQRLYTLESVLLASLVQGENDDRRVIELKELLDLRLQGIEFAIFNMKDSSGNARKELNSLKNQIDRLQREIKSQGLGNKELSESLEERDSAMIDRLNKMREDMIKAVQDTARLNASKRDLEAILKEIDNQDRLKKRDVLGIITDISSLVGMALTILPASSKLTT